MSIDNQYNLGLEQWDVKTPFLHAILEETIYMQQHEGRREIISYGNGVRNIIYRMIYSKPDLVHAVMISRIMEDLGHAYWGFQVGVEVHERNCIVWCIDDPPMEKKL